LIPWLAGVDPDSKTPRRNIARRADIPADVAPLIDLLVEERLLSIGARETRDPQTGEETRESTIEPTHEALLRQWGLLDGWLKEDFALLTRLEGAKRATHDWEANARADSWLVHQGQRLVDAETLDARPDIAARLDSNDVAYLAACRTRQEVVRVETEQRRQEREAEHARRLADAEKLAAAEQRTVRRTRIGLFAASLLAIAAAAFAYTAQTEKRIADRKTEEAVSQKENADAAKRDAVAQKDLADSAAMKAIRNQSVALTALAVTEAVEHPIIAAKLALAAWPRDSADPAPKLDATLDLLGQVAPQLRERVRIRSAGTVASFSPDGTRVVTAPDDTTARIWDAADGHEIAKLEGHAKGVTFAAFSPDGKSIVTTSKDNTARVWDAATGRDIATLKGHDDVVTSAAFSPDGRRVVTASEDNSARVWDAGDGRPIAILNGHGDNVTSAAFSPDGGRVVTASADRTARIWRAADGVQIATLQGHDAAVTSAAFSPDGEPACRRPSRQANDSHRGIVGTGDPDRARVAALRRSVRAS